VNASVDVGVEHPSGTPVLFVVTAPPGVVPIKGKVQIDQYFKCAQLFDKDGNHQGSWAPGVSRSNVEKEIGVRITSDWDNNYEANTSTAEVEY
jgi:hypothetical protein